MPILAAIAICHALNGLPDPACTPGATDPCVTQENIQQTICGPNYSKTVRPSVSVTNPMKRQVMAEYGLPDQNPRLYEGDHLVSIEIGGYAGPDVDCDFHVNFWPEQWGGELGAHTKDKVENAAHRLVCSGQLPLAEAQQKIATDWIGFYRERL